MVKAVWKMISFFLALAGFLTVGVVSLVCGEDLLWVVVKAVAAFAVAWLILGYLGGILLVVIDRDYLAAAATTGDQETAAGAEKG